MKTMLTKISNRK